MIEIIVEDLKESQIGTGDQESRALIATKARWAMKKALRSGKKQSQAWWNKQVKLADIDANDKPAAVLQALSKEEIEEGIKDLPPHLQKLIKKIEKKQKDWNKQNPDAKIQTLVYNPETGKPDIIVKETMKLEDTVKQVLETNKNDKSDDGEGLDAVQPKAVKKKFKDRKDKDIDNDGDTDDSDKFLHKKRKAISKAIAADKKEQKTYSKLYSHVKNLMSK